MTPLERRFDLILFDLDDTLLRSGHLEAFRGREHVGPQPADYHARLREQLGSVEILISAETLLALQEQQVGVRLGVFTKAPREYTAALLEFAYPTIEWAVVITFEDVGRTKPHADGLLAAANQLSVPPKRVLLIGDAADDIRAAYNAGAKALLFTAAWASRQAKDAKDQDIARQLLPDGEVNESTALRSYVADPLAQLLPLEQLMARRWPAPKAAVTKSVYLQPGDVGSPVKVSVLGRYFKANGRRGSEAVTRIVLLAKERAPYPQHWSRWIAARLRHHIAALRSKLGGAEVFVTVIPARPGRSRRMENFLDDVRHWLKRTQLSAIAVHDVLAMAPSDATKGKSKRQRVASVGSALGPGRAIDRIRGKIVYVIDDVCTTGATFWYARDCLLRAGAVEVVCLALTRTVSDYDAG